MFRTYRGHILTHHQKHFSPIIITRKVSLLYLTCLHRYCKKFFLLLFNVTISFEMLKVMDWAVSLICAVILRLKVSCFILLCRITDATSILFWLLYLLRAVYGYFCVLGLTSSNPCFNNSALFYFKRNFVNFTQLLVFVISSCCSVLLHAH